MYRYILQCDTNKYCSVFASKNGGGGGVCALCSDVQVADGEMFWVWIAPWGDEVGYPVSAAH